MAELIPAANTTTCPAAGCSVATVASGSGSGSGVSLISPATDKVKCSASFFPPFYFLRKEVKFHLVPLFPYCMLSSWERSTILLLISPTSSCTSCRRGKCNISVSFFVTALLFFKGMN